MAARLMAVLPWYDCDHCKPSIWQAAAANRAPRGRIRANRSGHYSSRFVSRSSLSGPPRCRNRGC